MSSYRFTGPYPVVLSERGLLVDPGDTVAELDDPPGPDWEPTDGGPAWPSPPAPPAPPTPTETDPQADSASEED